MMAKLNFEALFIGPMAENGDFFKQMLNFLVDEHLFWRRNFHPEDNVSITLKDKSLPDFISTMQRTEEVLQTLSSRLRTRSMPWHSPRYLGHMNSDLLIPALLAYMVTIMYNPNNVAFEGSPATTELELEVGRDLATLIGFDPDKSWGHVTSGGTVANYEGLWVARNLKYIPMAVKKVCPSLVRGYNDRELINLSPSNILKLISEAKEMGKDVVDNIRMHSLRSKGLHKIETNLGKVLIPSTMHYSWAKAMDILGLGIDALELIPVDEKFRMDIGYLKKKIYELAENGIPIIAVIGVVGTTEEGSVDEIDKIVELRTQLERERGVSFYIHIDAAYGGYARSVFLNENMEFMDLDELRERLDKDGIVSKDIGWPEEDIYNSFKALSYVDSVTIDPHKMGYVPYQAGAIVFRDKRVRDIISYFAPYVFEEEKWKDNPQLLGSFIMEGSKAGASVAAVWAAHKVVPLNVEGYGRIIGESIEGARMLWSKIEEMEVEDFVAKCLCKPDLNILCYAFNKRYNKNLDKMNFFNEKIKKFMSYDTSEFNRPIHSYDHIVSSTKLSRENYGKAVDEFLKKLGLDLSDEGKEVFILRSCVMTPYLTKDYTEEDYSGTFIKSLKKTIKELKW